MTTKKISAFLKHPIVVRTLPPLIIILILSIFSQIVSDNWAEWFSNIPDYFWIIITLIIIGWIIYSAVQKRLNAMENEGGRFGGLFIPSAPIFGWVIIGKEKYADVLWNVRLPSSAVEGHIDSSDSSPENIDIALPPRCPKCETEIEESPKFLGGFLWRCVACDFQTGNKDSYTIESNRVRKIAKRKFEAAND